MMEERNLSPDTTEILKALIASADDDQVVTEDPEPLLARFACGWVTDEEREQAIVALAGSEHLRFRLLEMRDALKVASESAEQRERVLAADPLLASTLRAALGSLLRVYSDWKQACTRFFAGAALSEEERRSVLLALRRISTDLGRQSPSVAAFRGESSTRKVTLEPGHIVAELTIADSDGSLEASARLSQPMEMELSLFVTTRDGDWIPLGSSPVEETHWRLSVDKGPHLPSGFDASSFALAPTPPSRSVIRLDIPDQDPVWLNLTVPPRVERGIFELGIELPTSVRSAWSGGSLYATLASQAFPIAIGEWPLQTLPQDSSILLSAPLPEGADGELQLATAVRLSVRAG